MPALPPVPRPTPAEVDLVSLDHDHPGFRDPAYRRRRGEVASASLAWKPGDPPLEITYSEEENRVWRTVIEHLDPLHGAMAGSTWKSGRALFPFERGSVPQHREINDVLASRTGFTFVPVPGLVSPLAFLQQLAEGVFFATQYLRHPSRPLYTPEPDVVHEVVGHAPMLADRRVASLHRLFGRVACHVDPSLHDAVIRLYWWTMEFGLVGDVRDPSSLRVLGAGLLSSFGEMGAMRQDVRFVPLDLTRAMATRFDPTGYQPQLFVAPSEDALFSQLEAWLGAHCQ